MPFDHQLSALQQVTQVTAALSLEVWSGSLAGLAAPSTEARDLATLLLAVNYELLGYAPEQAWMLARRGESAAPGRLDG